MWYKRSESRATERRERMNKIRDSRMGDIERLTNDTGSSSIQLSHESGERGVMINPSGRIANKWQLSYFDKNGFSADATHNTKKEAIEEAVNGGFTTEKDLITEFMKDPAFMKGNEVTTVMGYMNQVGLRGSREIEDAYMSNGLPAAKKVYDKILAEINDEKFNNYNPYEVHPDEYQKAKDWDNSQLAYSMKDAKDASTVSPNWEKYVEQLKIYEQVAINLKGWNRGQIETAMETGEFISEDSLGANNVV